MSIVITEKTTAFRTKIKDELEMLIKEASIYGMDNDVEFDTCILTLQSVLSDQILDLEKSKKKFITRTPEVAIVGEDQK